MHLLVQMYMQDVIRTTDDMKYLALAESKKVEIIPKMLRHILNFFPIYK